MKVIMFKCFFCGESNKLVLQEHHIIPKYINIYLNNEETIILCANCHIKLHRLINPLTKYITLDWSKQKIPKITDDEIKNKACFAVIQFLRKNKQASLPFLTHAVNINYNIGREEIIEALTLLSEKGVIFQTNVSHTSTEIPMYKLAD